MAELPQTQRLQGAAEIGFREFSSGLGGYDWNYLLTAEKWKHLSCGLCKKLLRDAVELSCSEHAVDEDADPVLYCKSFANFVGKANICQTRLHRLPRALSKRELQ